MLQGLSHPAESKENSDAYSMTLDQNILNSFAHEIIKSKRELSLRKMLHFVDRGGKMIPHLTTKYLSLNMPAVINDYGPDS